MGSALIYVSLVLGIIVDKVNNTKIGFQQLTTTPRKSLLSRSQFPRRDGDRHTLTQPDAKNCVAI